MSIKVHGGTRDGNKPALCGSCRMGLLVQGEAEGQDKVFCRAMAGGFGTAEVRMKVIQCSSYSDRSQPALSDLYDIAWVLETSKNRRNIGFTPWKEYRKTHQDEGYASPPMGF